MEQQDERSVYEQVVYKKQQGQLVLTQDGLSFSSQPDGPPLVHVAWTSLVKHQVSPASYPKALLKLIIARRSGLQQSENAATTNLTFQLPQRTDLDRIRKEITQRLTRFRSQQTALSGKKRSFAEVSQSKTTTKTATATPVFGGQLDKTSLAVTRASLLAAHPSLRQQHHYLVEETGTVTEDDFWSTHNSLLQEEYARIAGVAKAGHASLLQSHLPIARGGRVTLGVEEIRQIFILYPAVYKAYEEKVPLELSDEQFWRKYLESEYFHRDRGREGTAARNHSAATAESKNSPKDKNKSSGPSVEEQEARAAAVGTDDMFSRYDQKLRQEGAAAAEPAASAAAGVSDLESHRGHRKWGRKLAVGQFDLASTFETERGRLLEAPRDNHPPNNTDDGEKGARVIQKYNRHWAMVLHPEEAVAGANLTEIARRSVQEVLPDDVDADPEGGVDAEMRRLVEFAQASEEEANHAAGIGHDDFEPLTLKNVEAYYTGQTSRQTDTSTAESTEEADKRYAVFATAIAAKTQSLVNALSTNGNGNTLSSKCFPPAGLGRDLLSALTKKMALDSRTESASLEMVNKLPEDFRVSLKAYFRRSSELLRHFFGLRRLEAQGISGHSQKLARIVRGIETFYREMEAMREALPQTETGNLMRKMCDPITKQLDWAFQLHREGKGESGGGGFVEVEENF